MSDVSTQPVEVLAYYEYCGGPGSQTVYTTQYFCGACRRRIHDPYHFPEYPDDLEKQNEEGWSKFELASERGLELEHFTFCPWCGVRFEDEWWRDPTIQNERAIDHYQNPGTHNGDRHEFRGDGPDCIAGHWLAGGDEVCWCDPEIEPGVLGCVIRHRDASYEDYVAAERARHDQDQEWDDEDEWLMDRALEKTDFEAGA